MRFILKIRIWYEKEQLTEWCGVVLFMFEDSSKLCSGLNRRNTCLHRNLNQRSYLWTFTESFFDAFLASLRHQIFSFNTIFFQLTISSCIFSTCFVWDMILCLLGKGALTSIMIGCAHGYPIVCTCLRGFCFLHEFRAACSWLLQCLFPPHRVCPPGAYGGCPGGRGTSFATFWNHPSTRLSQVQPFPEAASFS